jgi:MFS family permease
LAGLRTPLERILITFWVGAMWVVGYVVAPTLFAMLERSVAGDVAGRLFGYVSMIGFICGGLLLFLALFLDRRRPGWLRSWNIWILAAMLSITIFNELLVSSQLAELRLAAGGEWVPDTPLQRRFAKLHGVASALFVVNSLLGLVLLVRWGRSGGEHDLVPNRRDNKN